MKGKRNKYLTKGMDRALRDMVALDEGGEIGEIVCDGNECWVGFRRTTWGTVNRLLRLCLLTENDSGGAMHYDLNQESYSVLKDPNYEPMILEALRTGKPVIR